MTTNAAKKILVVDDEQDIRLIIRLVLEKYNFSVLEAGNGKKALEMLANDANKEIACVITDYLMPQMNGLQLCQQLRKDHHYLNSIFLITAYLDNEQFEKTTCFDEKFMKPLDFEELVKKLNDHIAHA
ncbi:MAG: response regulator [Candidatus Lokiarchaeota archaeon]|nr:response regulator [Candidatus Lokiarchaeota archaeon]